MSLLKAIKQQLGLSTTPANNFTLDASADNGTMKLARGNAGVTTQDIITVNASGIVSFPQGTDVLPSQTGNSGGLLTTNGTTASWKAVKFVSSDQTFALAGLITVAHGLGSIPTFTTLQLVCQTAEGGWSIGDVINHGNFTSNYTSSGLIIYCDATNVNIRVGNTAVYSGNKTTGVYFALTPANWKLRITAINL